MSHKNQELVAPLWWKVFKEPLPVLWLNFRQIEAALGLQMNVWTHLVWEVRHPLQAGGFKVR